MKGAWEKVSMAVLQSQIIRLTWPWILFEEKFLVQKGVIHLVRTHEKGGIKQSVRLHIGGGGSSGVDTSKYVRKTKESLICM